MESSETQEEAQLLLAPGASAGREPPGSIWAEGNMALALPPPSHLKRWLQALARHDVDQGEAKERGGLYRRDPLLESGLGLWPLIQVLQSQKAFRSSWPHPDPFAITVLK